MGWHQIATKSKDREEPNGTRFPAAPTSARVDVSPVMLAELTRFSRERGISKNLLVRQAIALLLRVLEAELQGQKLALVDQERNALYEIVIS